MSRENLRYTAHVRPVALFSTLIIASAGVHAQEDTVVTALLERVAAKYKTLNDYVVEIESSDFGQCLNCNSMVRPFGPPTPSSIGPRSLNRIILARRDAAVHYEVRTEGLKYGLTQITDGVTSWHYRPDLKEYIQETVSPSPPPTGPGHGLPGLEWSFLMRFRALSDFANRARVIRRCNVLGDSCSGPSTLVEIRISENPVNVEELLISDESSLVCESTLVQEQVRRGFHRRYTTKTRWRFRTLWQPIPAELFVFVPPKKTRRVKRFSSMSSTTPESISTSAPFGLPSGGPPP